MRRRGKGVEAPDWGIDPVPRDRRVLSGLDLAILWGDLGIGLLVLVTGALLVPGLGFPTALLAIVVGSVIGVGLLSLVAVAGADHGVPTMVLFRPVLGQRDSWVPSSLNVLQLIGWTAVELWAMSYVADLIVEESFGFSSRWVWLVAASVICIGLALWGPIGVTRVWMKRFGVWVIGGISLAITVLALTSPGIADALSANGTGAFPTFGPALDLVIAMPISWLPLVADYTRFARSPRAAGIGTSVGYLIANVWLYSLGALVVLASDASPDPAGIAAGILALAGGSVAGLLFLMGLLVGETDEAFADIYSASVTLQNVFPRLSQRALVVGIGVVATILAAWLTMERYEAFLFLIGSVFVPLFGILAADYFVLRRRRIDPKHLFGQRGPYWYSNGVRIITLLPWTVGFLVYHWIAPTGPSWWTDAFATVVGTPLAGDAPWLPASVPSFVAAFLLSLLVMRAGEPARGGLSSQASIERGEG